jgi:hypothetical protein
VGANGITYQWVPSTGLDCATCPNTLASPDVTTTYTLIATGCGSSSSGEVTVTVLPADDFTLLDREICPSTGGAIGIGAPGNTGSLSNVSSYSLVAAQQPELQRLCQPDGQSGYYHLIYADGTLQ